MNEDFEIIVEDNKSRAMNKAKEAIDACQRDTTLPIEEQIVQLAACMEKEVQKALNQTKNEIDFQATLRKDMGQSLVQYTCDDPKAATTESYRNESWVFRNPSTKQQETHEVQVLFETDNTAIKYIPNMLTVEQCQSFMEATEVDENQQRVLPATAKKSMSIVEILMKVQNLYKSFVGLSVAFSSDPLLVLESHKAEPQLADGECAVCDDKDANSHDCAKRPDNVAPGVRRHLLESDQDGENPVETSLLLVCATGQGGALHFPRTGTHIATKQPGDAILLIHRDGSESDKERFLQDMAVCQPWLGELVYAFHQTRQSNE